MHRPNDLSPRAFGIRASSWARKYQQKFTTRRKILLILNLLLAFYTIYTFHTRPVLASEPRQVQTESQAERALKASLRPESTQSAEKSARIPKAEQKQDLLELVELFGLDDESEFYEMFEDAEEFLAAPRIKVRPHNRMDYQKRWNRLYAHVQYYSTHIHKRYIPRLQQNLSPEKFITRFMMTSTPVIIPSERFSHLNYTVPAYESLEELANAFPEIPNIDSFPGYVWSGVQKSSLNLRPAVKYLIEHKMDTEGKHEEDETCYKAQSGTKFCHYPRNTKLDVKHLKHLGILRPPPFLYPRCFQNPSIWMAPPKHHTSNHHDASDNFIVHLLGIKRWTLFPPVDSKFMYRTCVQKGLCKARIKHPDTPATEEARNIVQNLANKVVVDIKPGDVLYLPNGWFHHVEAVDGTTTLIANFWTRLDYQANGALQRGMKNQTWQDIHRGINTMFVKNGKRMVIKV